jgi:lipid-binding SYLF domain-containing protein
MTAQFQPSRILSLVLAIILAFAPANSKTARAQSSEDAQIVEATGVLNEIMQIPSSSIPRAMLANAQAVVIVPRVIKASFVVGARRGHGVALVRDSNGNWQAPAFVTLTGGNLGWQVGVQSTDVVLVFKTRTSVDRMLAGQFTIGGDAAAAAGPVGRNAAIATDEQLRAEVYSYSRSRGLFAGISIDGSVIKLNQEDTARYYQPAGPGQPTQIPDSAARLVQTLMGHTGESATATIASAPADRPPMLMQPAAPVSDADKLREQIRASAAPLYRLLDRSWQAYLAMPQEVLAAGNHPAPQLLSETLARFDGVQAAAQYQALTTRIEFQTAHELLKKYHAALLSQQPTLGLPSPPSIAPNR